MSYIINIVKQSAPEHKHKNYEIITYLKGGGTFYAENKELYMSPGTIIVVPPGILHHSTRKENSERIYICGEFGQIFNFDYVVSISDNLKKEGLLLAQMLYDNRFGNPEYVSSLANTLAHFIVQSLNMQDQISIKIQKIIEHITNNFYDSALNVGALLNQSGYAEDYIRAKFKQVTGKTPIEFLTYVRISHACYLLTVYKKTISIGEIAESCGYSDYIYFSRKFKQIKGMSPREYMKFV